MSNPRTAILDIALADLQVMQIQINNLTELADLTCKDVDNPFIFPVVAEIHATVERLTDRVDMIERHIRHVEAEMYTTSFPCKHDPEELHQIIADTFCSEEAAKQIVEDFFSDVDDRQIN
ncbi:hypothetical protein M0G74_09030 [Microbulbifer sp. CAU 1566]|uniref:hypothetical protein n=1 Tax=Microbulbifer sp. CAU 1566 TaxID=2933269 RepID=UPI002006950A|nr:hypothetical protein [Microbulbifer sp. CAU 1566]MCK7597409.1 hypothetical protein [Microbulbifer sp. CAU 1566]